MINKSLASTVKLLGFNMWQRHNSHGFQDKFQTSMFLRLLLGKLGIITISNLQGCCKDYIDNSLNDWYILNVSYYYVLLVK